MGPHGHFLATRLMQDQLGGPFSPYQFHPGEPDDVDPADHAPLSAVLVAAMLAITIVVVVAIAIWSPGSVDSGTSAAAFVR